MEGDLRPTELQSYSSTVARTFAVRVLGIVLAVVSSIVLSRVLGPAGRGRYTLALLLGSLLVFYTSLGLGQAATFFLNGNRFAAGTVIGTTCLSAAALSLLAIAIGLIIAATVGTSIFRGATKGDLLLAVTVIPVAHIYGVGTFLLLGLHRIRLHNILEVVRSLSGVILLVSFLSLLSAGVTGAIAAETLTMALVAAALLLTLRRIVAVKWHWDGTYFVAATRFGLASLTGTTLTFWHYRIDILILGWLLRDPVQVGLYSLAVSLCERLSILGDVASTLLFPREAARHGRSLESVDSVIVFRAVLAITLLAAIILLSLAAFLVSAVFGNDFQGAVAAIPGLALGTVSLAGWTVLDAAMKGRGKPGSAASAMAIGLATNVALNLVMIPRLGISGAAWASGASYTTTLIVAVLIFIRASRCRARELLVPGKSDIRAWKSIVLQVLRRRGTASPSPPAGLDDLGLL